MDEAMVERVKDHVSRVLEKERANPGASVGLIKIVGFGYLDTTAITVEKIEAYLDWWAEQPLIERPPGANKAKHAEMVEQRLDQARFWETAAAMLKAAEVQTLGELLED